MADNAPDLIQRAAARLKRNQSEDVAPTPAVVAKQIVRPVAPPPIDREATSAHARSGLTPSETGRPYADLSPTVLAAHGIVHPSSGFSRTREEFRSLKRHVLSKVSRGSNGADSAEQRIILVTSARPGEGKTFTATNLALALAYEKDTRVLLMDADAYRQSLTTYLGISSNTGWLDSMETHGDAETHVIRTNVPDFSVLSTGKERAEIPELMSSRKMKQLLDDLVRSDPGRLVIMDALPCLTSTEPSILAALAGQTLFVVAALETSREDLESSLRLLGASPKVSLVLNKTEPMLTEQFKSYGYAYGYQR